MVRALTMLPLSAAPDRNDMVCAAPGWTTSLNGEPWMGAPSRSTRRYALPETSVRYSTRYCWTAASHPTVTSSMSTIRVLPPMVLVSIWSETR